MSRRRKCGKTKGPLHSQPQWTNVLEISLTILLKSHWPELSHMANPTCKDVHTFFQLDTILPQINTRIILLRKKRRIGIGVKQQSCYLIQHCLAWLHPEVAVPLLNYLPLCFWDLQGFPNPDDIFTSPWKNKQENWYLSNAKFIIKCIWLKGLPFIWWLFSFFFSHENWLFFMKCCIWKKIVCFYFEK